MLCGWCHMALKMVVHKQLPVFSDALRGETRPQGPGFPGPHHDLVL